MRLYFIHDGQKQVGPFTLIELKQQHLSKTTPIWYEGLAAWSTVDQIPELSALSSVPPYFTAQNTHSIPPPITNSYPWEEKKEAKKSFFFPMTIGGVFIALLVGWLVYNSSTQAAVINRLDYQQTQETVEKVQKEDEAQRVNDALTKRNMQYRNNWSNYIGVKTNQYRYAEIGGIYGLKLIVSNSTACVLDEVVATVSYIKTNGGIWKTIEVPISNIPANASKSITVPDVERGTSVDVNVKSIVSKKMHFYYEEGYSSGNPEDPYFNK